MHIFHISSELAPIAKVGGLGDVVAGLSKELLKLGHTVQIILPKYDCLDLSKIENLKVEHREVWSFEGPYRYNNTIWSGKIEGLELLLIESHHQSYYFSRGCIYGCPDDADRFIYFCRSALEYLFKTNKSPDIVHVHDWPLALTPVLYKEMYIPLGLKIGRFVLTLHNLEHQGKCNPDLLDKVGLKKEQFLTPDKMQDPVYPNLINLLKGGIVYSDVITTVSPNYEKEIKTKEGGFFLDPLLIKNQNKLHGILNGIDESTWNPEIDTYLSPIFITKKGSKIKTLRACKKENKVLLQSRLKLQKENSPLVATISRLARQKGPELIKHALLRTLEKGGQFVLLGSGLPHEIKEFLELQEKYKNNKNVAICLTQDESLAHLIFAASDMFIIPSLFEPCGLTQMIALRYGTVPIVRKTGGLADTVFDIDTANCPINERNGFTFDFPDDTGVNWALDRALDCFQNDEKKWDKIILNGIKQDFSWATPAAEYVKVYTEEIKLP